MSYFHTMHSQTASAKAHRRTSEKEGFHAHFITLNLLRDIIPTTALLRRNIPSPNSVLVPGPISIPSEVSLVPGITVYTGHMRDPTISPPQQFRSLPSNSSS